MKHWRLVIGTLVALGLLLAAFPGAALAEERTCRGSLGAVRVDNLRVPQYATCTLNGTYVKGTIKVERGATLNATRIRVIGNIQAENHRNVVVRSSSVGGSIQVKQGGGASVYSTIVKQDIQYDHNRSYLRSHYNRVGGNIQVVGNRGGAGIIRNVVVGNLQCKENSPAPTGYGNRVYGSKEGQCRRL